MSIWDTIGKTAEMGSTFGLLDKWINGRDPYKEANKQWGQIPGQTQPYYQDYMNAGKNALGQLQGEYGSLIGGRQGLQDQYGQLMNDPTAVMNKIGSQYQQSPGYQYQMDQAMGAANNAAASGGMAGSPQHQQQAATMATGLANQDYNNFMNQGLAQYNQGLQGGANMYGMGVQGMQGINQMGFGANDQMAAIIAQMLGRQGQGAFAGQAGQNQSRGNMFGSLAGLLGGLI